MTHLTKAKLVIFALALMAGIGGYMRVDARMEGWEEGYKASDQEAFNAYVAFAKPFQKEIHKKHAKAQPVYGDEFAVLEGK